MDTELQRLCDATLIDGLSPALKAAIDRLRARGASRAGILGAVRAMIARAGGSPRGTVGLAVEAYLDRAA